MKYSINIAISARRILMILLHFLVSGILTSVTWILFCLSSLILNSQRGRSCPVSKVLSSQTEGPGSRFAWRKLPFTLMAPGACKIRRGCNVLQVPVQIILLGVPRRGSHPLHDGSKLRWHASGSSFGMNPRPSAIAH